MAFIVSIRNKNRAKEKKEEGKRDCRRARVEKSEGAQMIES
jgi:hypothetical protein